ncbi:MAG: gamma-glutamyl-gamma-aminobutyrate hydrolase family protein [Acidobacteriota bacterium]|nr:gamma-glutamyl-gamma-aminobutyrate hydrolase family protein [Acidobacteriota bacterium]
MTKPRILVPYPKPDYIEALMKAGADIATLDVSARLDDAMAGIDGVLLTGGEDIEPSLYSEDRHPATQDAEPGRDELELAIARRAIDADLPLFAICRGLQVMNVAAGGTLVQDIPSEIGQLVSHDQREPRDFEAHSVRIKPGSKLAGALASEIDEHGETLVNSRHHQAVGTLAPDMDVTAVAPDGITEAIERADRRFCVGVQWHPENFHRSGRFSGLFEAFVKSAGGASLGG